MTCSDRSLDRAEAILGRLFGLLDDGTLRGRIDDPIDLAAEGFISRVTQPPGSHAEFNALIAGLYRHVQESARTTSPLPPELALDEATSLLDQGYEGLHANGYYAALLDARDASPQGAQLVLHRLAELIKARRRWQYVRWVIARNVALLDWDTKRALAGLLLDRCRPWLPPEMQGAAPEQFTDCVEDLLIADLSTDARLGGRDFSFPD